MLTTGYEFLDLIEKTSSSVPFESEAFLINAVVDKISEFIEGDTIVTSKEIPIGAGKVDIVAGSIDKHMVAPKYELLSDLEAYILSTLHFKQRLTLQTIIQRAELPVDKVVNTIEQLTRKRYCEMSGQCYLRSRTNIQDIAAIEGKIKDWKRALTQANRNRLFTSQSFVALDARYSKPALRNLSEFRDARVGLAIVFGDGEVAVVYKPPRNQPLASIMPILAESALLERMS